MSNLKVYDGTSWIAAASLPISSDDGKVTLGVRSGNIFTVSIDSSNIIEAAGPIKGVGINTVATDKAALTVKTNVVNATYGTQGVNVQASTNENTRSTSYFDSFLSDPIIVSDTDCHVIHFRAYDNPLKTETTVGDHVGFGAGSLTSSTTRNIGFWSMVAQDETKQNYAFYASSTAPSFFNGDIQCKVMRSQIDTSPASMSFVGNDVSFSGQTVIFDVGPTPGLNFDISQNESGLVGGSGVLLLTRQYDLSFASNSIRFNSDYNSGGNLVHWVMENDGGLVGSPSSSVSDGGYVQVLRIKGLNSTDAEITLDSSAKIAKADGTAFTPSVDSSIATKKYVDDSSSSSIVAGTPASANAAGSAGDMQFDESFLWLKTATEWKKVPLLTFGATPTGATLQLTAAQYAAIPVKDPNTLYVIVG